MKIFLPYIITIFTYSLTFSQYQLQIDSIQKLITDYDAKKTDPNRSEPNDTLKIDWLLYLSGLHYGPGFDKSILFAQEAENLSRQINDVHRLSRCYNTYGCSHFVKGYYNLAIPYFQKELVQLKYLDSLGYAPKVIFTDILTNSNNIGVMYHSMGNTVDAIRYFLIGMKLNEAGNDTLALAQSNMRIAQLYFSIHSHDEATLYCKKALRLFHLLYDEPNIILALNTLAGIEFNQGHFNVAEILFKSAMELAGDLENNFTYLGTYGMIGHIYKRKGEAQEALKYFQLQLKGCLDAKDNANTARALIDIGEVFADLGSMDSALLYLYRAIDTSRFYDHVGILSSSYISLGNVYRRMGDYVNAEKYILKGMELPKGGMILGDNYYAYEELVALYAESKDYKRAYQYHVLLKEIDDSIHIAANANKITQLTMQFDIDQSAQAHQSELDRKDVAQRAEVSQQKQQKKFYIAGGIFLFLLSGGLVNRLVYTSKTKRLLEEKSIEIEKEKLRAEQSERFKQQFLANMSHEIRTPMNAVMGMTHLLLAKNPRKDQQPYLEGIKKSSDNLLHIINAILDLAKIEAGKMELEHIDFSLPEVIGQVEQLLKYNAYEKRLQWIVEIDSNLPILLGDPVRLYQVLMNLAGNAIKFTDKGSVQIIVRKSFSDQTTDLIPIQFSVIDTGIGIANDKLDKVFENFQQANTSDSRKYGGTGLGLSISKQLIELLGGKITIESEENSGTTFSFILPFQKGSEERLRLSNTPEVDVDGSILNGLKILIADDNAYNLMVSTDTLKLKADVSIRTATTGKEAIALLRENDFDLILMDVQMPEWNGFEATQYIRTQLDSPKKDIPIIAFTASVLRTDLDKCRQAGMNSYIAKPFTSSQLISGIAEVLNIETQTHHQERKENQFESTIHTSANTVTDLTYLKNFCKGDEVTINKYISIFLQSAPELIRSLESALQSRDYAEIASQIHGFSTKLMMFGMGTSKELGTKIELQCRSASPDDTYVRTNLPKLLTMVERAVVELHQEIKKGNNV